jgi:8-oxo-dGTP pyrophosphatase MutT (NUDIX family)
MLRLIPAPLHRSLYRIADRSRRLWWRLRRPHRHSVAVVAFDRHGQVLLVRHSYGRPVWMLPGGGIGRHEDPARAAAREFREELGCELAELALLESSDHIVSGSRDTQYVFTALADGTPKADMREIVDVDFFPPAGLPPGCSRSVGGRVERAAAARSHQR